MPVHDPPAPHVPEPLGPRPPESEPVHLKAVSGLRDGSSWLAVPPAGTVHLWCGMVGGGAEAVGDMVALLSEDERARAARLDAGPPRLAFLLGRAVLRVLLGRYSGHDPRTLRFASAAHGKPYLSDPALARPLWFSVSHADHLVGIAVATGGEVGLDLERVEADRDLAPLARRTLTAREEAEWAELPVETRRRALARCRTRKASMLKALGTGLAVDPRTVEVGHHAAPPGWTLRACEPVPGYVGCVAAR
ncbi:MAG TPA: 4'-phosphopantetheinyl transferase superfamily protein, partial [Methylomirabilota bacterium]|nr:4'-phosphopantetheinyl transferase superfamily protein [Methylomirabilota bacterium]